jgi:cell division protein FtsB
MRAPVVLAVAAAIAVVVVGIGLFSPSGLARLERLRSEEEALQAEVARRTTENERLTEEIALLRGDTEAGRNAIEKRAREELGFVGAGEVVLTVPVDGAAGSVTR